MKKPKTIKGFLTMLVSVADSGITDLKGSEKLSHTDFHRMVTVVAALQNELGEIEDLLHEFGLSWPPN